MMISSDRRYCGFHRAAPLGVVALFVLTLVSGLTREANAQALVKSGEVIVYATADESAAPIEAVREGGTLVPLGEMTGGGGEKWFMVKTPSGNVGWIKAGDHAQARRVDDHFRSLPKDAGIIGPVGSAAEPVGKMSTGGAVAIPVKMQRNQVIVPVTFSHGNSSVTGNLVMDTGASRTTISKRMARDLRLLASGYGYSAGIGGTVPTEVAVVEGMRVGTIGFKNLRVSILDFSKDPSYEGLLGFDFLSQFQMSVDSDKQVMVLTPRKSDTK